MRLESRRIGASPDTIAPDGSEVRVLCATARGGMATFSLPPHVVSRAMVHRTVDEVWYVISGRGRMWRKWGDHDEIVDLDAGVSLAIPVGAHFQFRSDDDATLVVIAATVPPWPGPDEAISVAGPWEATA